MISYSIKKGDYNNFLNELRIEGFDIESNGEIYSTKDKERNSNNLHIGQLTGLILQLSSEKSLKDIEKIFARTKLMKIADEFIIPEGFKR